jgi:uncharacterized protein DUF7033
MNASAGLPAPGAVAWLGRVLEERFGHRFELQTFRPGAISLRVPGHSGSIVFDRTYTRFDAPSPSLPCSSWDAHAEGWRAPLDRPLPAPGAATLPARVIEQTPEAYTLRYDVLGLVRWMLGRFEELGSHDLDAHGRFPATASHAHRHGYLERPIVDEWLDVLGQVVQRAWPGLPLARHAFVQRVSHDVDCPSRYGFCSPLQLVRAIGGDILRRKDFGSLYRSPRLWLGTGDSLNPKDPYNTFDWILDASESHGLKSAFYFICGRTDARRDAQYEPDHPAIVELMRKIHARGHEIGLHPSYGTYQSPDAIAAEAARLKRICAEAGIVQAEWGGRMHFLRWQTPITLQGWVRAGMTYDSSLAYADRPGFRAGTCFEYPALDPLRDEGLALRVRPLIAMEATIIGPRYMALGTGEAALDKFLELKRACRAVAGCFTLLWHNSRFTTPGDRELYRTILAS